MVWLSGMLLALLQLLAYASWLPRRTAGLSMGGYALLDGGQFRGGLGLGLALVHWGLLLLGTYLVTPRRAGRRTGGDQWRDGNPRTVQR